VIGQRIFVTFRLHGSLPDSRIFRAAKLTAGQAFVAMDRLLDHAKSGPMFLSRPEIAEMVIRAFADGEHRFRRYELHAFVIMSDHVHLLVTPRVPSRKWLGPLKGFTGHEAIRMLGLRNGPFWQDESYDHLIRSDEESAQVKRYIEWNPVKAGLVTLPEEFPFSSAGRKPGGRPEGLAPQCEFTHGSIPGRCPAPASSPAPAHVRIGSPDDRRTNK
jgi:REP element-mobilizing transposase RayT